MGYVSEGCGSGRQRPGGGGRQRRGVRDAGEGGSHGERGSARHTKTEGRGGKRVVVTEPIEREGVREREEEPQAEKKREDNTHGVGGP